MKNLVLLSTLLAFCMPILAQDTPEDLERIWHNSRKSDEVRAEAGLDLAQHYFRQNPDSAEYWAEAAYEFAEENGLVKHQAEALNMKGISQTILGNLYAARSSTEQALRLYRSIDDPKGIIQTLTNLGRLDLDAGNYFEALERFLTVAELAEDEDDETRARAYLSIGNVYIRIDELDKAQVYYQKMIDISVKIGDDQLLAIGFSNVAQAQTMQGDFEKALDYSMRAIEMYERLEDTRGLARVKSNVAQLYLEIEDYGQAIKYALNARDSYVDLGDRYGEAHAELLIAKVYFRSGKMGSAVKNGEKVYGMAQELMLMDLVMQSAELLYEVYKDLGDNAKSLAMHEQYTMIRDSIENQEMRAELMRREMELEYEKRLMEDSLLRLELMKKEEVARREAELEMERRRRMGGRSGDESEDSEPDKGSKRQMALIILVVLAVGGGAFYFFRKRKKSE